MNLNKNISVYDYLSIISTAQMAGHILMPIIQLLRPKTIINLFRDLKQHPRDAQNKYRRDTVKICKRVIPFYTNWITKNP